jgi:NADH-quinone oxidoreductase subunit N
VTQSVDHVALAPAYAVAAAAVLVLLVDVALPPVSRLRAPVLLVLTAAGAVAGGVAAWLVSLGPDRGTFCTRGGTLPGGVDVGASCSLAADNGSAIGAALFCVLTLVVVGLSAADLASGDVPAGEYCFLLLCSLAGGVVLAGSRDLLTLVVALETLTLPVYVLVGLRLRPGPRAAEAAVTFLVVSVVSTAVTLLGAALLYALTGAVHLDRLAAALGDRDDLADLPLTAAAVVLVLAGLAFKLAAVPFHAWAPGVYDGAPVPIAGYLSTASKLGGVVALVLVAGVALHPWRSVVGPVLAVLAVATMTVGNLAALAQRRLVRLLAWSSVAQAGYVLAPLGALAETGGDGRLRVAVAGAVAYMALYAVTNLGAFGAVRLAGAERVDDLRGLGRRHPWVGFALVLALAGLAGLPPGLAGLFAKVVVVRTLVDLGSGWLALVVAVNAVIGLAYYVRVAARVYERAGDATGLAAGAAAVPAKPGRGAGVRTVAVSLAGVSVLAVVVGVLPQPLLDAAAAFLP